MIARGFAGDRGLPKPPEMFGCFRKLLERCTEDSASSQAFPGVFRWDAQRHTSTRRPPRRRASDPNM
eukprot:40311-Pyramimonas_sp.AAC.1